MNLNEHAQQLFKKIDIEKMFKDEMEKQIKETVKSTIDQSLRSYSDFGQQLDNYFKEHIKLDVSNLPMTSYSNFLTEQVADVIKDELNETRAQKIKKQIREKLGIYNVSEIKFDDLMQKLTDILYESLKDEYEENGGCYCGDPTVYRLVARPSEDTFEKFEILVIEGKEMPRSRYDVKANLFLSRDDKAYHSSTEKNPGPIEKLFAYYAFNGTLIDGVDSYDELIEYSGEY